MATEIEPLIMPFNPLWVTTSKREYREAVRRMGEEPGDTKGKDGLTTGNAPGWAQSKRRWHRCSPYISFAPFICDLRHCGIFVLLCGRKRCK